MEISPSSVINARRNRVQLWRRINGFLNRFDNDFFRSACIVPAGNRLDCKDRMAISSSQSGQTLPHAIFNLSTLKSVAWPEPAGCRRTNCNRRLLEQDASGKSGDAVTEQAYIRGENPVCRGHLSPNWTRMNGSLRQLSAIAPAAHKLLQQAPCAIARFTV
jgi:hypothetical protein